METKETKFKTNTRLLVISGLLSAIGLIIPLVVPKVMIIPGIMTITIGSHIAVIIAMFISPLSALAVSLVTALGFLISTNIVVALRALSHAIFAVSFAFISKRMLQKKYNVVILNFLVALVHAFGEILAVYISSFFFKELFELTPITPYYLFVLVGAVTALHSTIDFIIAYAVYVPLKKNKLIG